MANAHERFMQIVIEEARRGAAEGNVAVGSVVVHDENMVARGRNLVATESDPTAACGDVGIAQRRGRHGAHRILRVHARHDLRALPDVLRCNPCERCVHPGVGCAPVR